MHIYYRFYAKVLFLVAVLLLSVPTEERGLVLERAEAVRPFGEGTLICVIDSGDDMYSRQGLKAGFNYELLSIFAAQTGKSIDIRVARGRANYMDSLTTGAIDILVQANADTLDNPLIKMSRKVDNYNSWIIRGDRNVEMKEINLWLSSFMGTKTYNDLRSRFYSQYDPFKRLQRGTITRTISPYDKLIKKHAATLGWDWRLVAAVIYHESRFSISTFSSRGATGLMQVLPSTGEYYGVSDLINPEQNITAGTRHLARMQKMFSSEEFTPDEKVNFTLAAYNAGERRIEDCRLFASLNNYNNTVWDDIVKIIPDMRKYSFVYNDTLREGRFRGTETINYVSKIRMIYEAFCEICPEDN